MGEKRKKHGQKKDFFPRFARNKAAVFGMIVFCIIVLFAICAGFFGTYQESIEVNVMEKNLGPSAEHWFGTDEMGRDIFLRCIYGARTSLSVGFSAAILAMVAGCLIGVSAGFYGGLLDDIIMRAIDILTSIPGMLLAICLVFALGSGVQNLVLALMIARLSGFARQARNATLQTSSMEYVEAARAGGAKDFRIMLRHIFPNVFNVVLVHFTLQVASITMSISSLSFLGLGIAPPRPEWGAMIASAKGFMRSYPHMIIFPGLCGTLTAMSINLAGDGVRDALDPRLKN